MSRYTPPALTAIPPGWEDEPITLGFHHFAASWYAPHLLASCTKGDGFQDDIMLGDYPPGGGTRGEFCIEWRGLSGQSVPRLQLYDDAWHLLDESKVQALLAWLAGRQGQETTPEDLCAYLAGAGWHDLTQREKP